MDKPADDGAVASHEDVRRIIGDVDEAKLLAVVELRPTVGNIEDAVMWLSGDRDVFVPSPSLKGVTAQIADILTADEDEENSGRRS